MPGRKDGMEALEAHSRFWMDDLHVQPDRCVVVRAGEEIKLEKRMMQVLVMLAECAGETLSTEQLLIGIWRGTFYGDNPVTKTMSILRKRIGDDKHKPRYIRTIPKVGYRLIAPVTLPEDYRSMPADSDRWTQGSPYVGLSAFDARHAIVFCGRSRMLAELLAAMRSQIENERSFILMLGPSGCGKTSLLRAGAIPLLTQANGFDGLQALSVATCDLATAHGGDVLTPLAEALAGWTLNGRPVLPPQSTAQLKAVLACEPESIVTNIEAAFRHAAGRAFDDRPHTHLQLTIDHAEALVAADDIDADARDAFVRVLRTLCACTRTLTTMVARIDFYPQLMKSLPILAECKAGDGHFEVFAPREGEIAEIIRTPAWKADLSFEKHPETCVRLDDALRDAARSQPDALPLLQHTLQMLYEKRAEGDLLTFAAYEAIGGLEGAIAHRAEQVYSALPPEARDSLGKVLSRIVNLRSENDPVSARRPDVSDFDPNARVLIESFIRARLFVGGLHEGRPTVGVAHEALLRQWPRAVEWVQDNRRLLQAKSRLERAAERWHQEGRRDDHLLNPGIPLAEALQVSERLPGEIRGNESALLQASLRLSRRSRRIRQGVIVALCGLAILSSTSAILAVRAKNKADQSLKSIVRQADAFRAIGELVFRNADMVSAEPAFKSTTDTLRSASRANRESEEILFQYAISSYWLGNLYLQEGRLNDAREQWNAYLESCQELERLSPENLAWRKELSYAHTNLGNLDLRERQHARALVHFKAALSIKQALLSQQDPDPAALVDYADTLSWIGSTEESLAGLRSAGMRYESQIALLRPYIETGSADDDHRRQFTNALWRSARLLSAVGDQKGAEARILEGIRTLSALVASRRSGDIFMKDLANALVEASNIYALQGDQQAADRYIASASAVIESIAMNQRSPNAWLRLRETIRFRKSLRETGERRETAMQMAMSALESLLARYPQQQQIAIDIANARIARGLLREREGRHASAMEDWRRAVDVMAPFVHESKDHVILVPWILANELQGTPQRATGKKNMLLAAGYRADLRPVAP